MDVSSDRVPKDAEDEDEVKNLVVDDENDKTVVPCIAISEDLGDIQVSVEGNDNCKKYKHSIRRRMMP